jgi:hypothetical protein
MGSAEKLIKEKTKELEALQINVMSLEIGQILHDLRKKLNLLWSKKI